MNEEFTVTVVETVKIGKTYNVRATSLEGAVAIVMGGRETAAYTVQDKRHMAVNAKLGWVGDRYQAR